MVASIVPFLWFDSNLEDAIEFYQSVFPNVTVGDINRTPDGAVLTASFEIEGQRFMALNGGPEFRFTEAVSFFVLCDQAGEVDRYWDVLTADGGEQGQCGWLKDKFGLSWQIVPKRLMELMQNDNTEKVQRMFQKMLTMQKLDMAALQQAFDGN